VPVPPGQPTPFQDRPTERHLFAEAPAEPAPFPTTDDAAADDRPDEPDDLLEPDWDQPRRYSRLTIALAIGVLVVLAFAVGAFTAGALRGPADALCTPPGEPPAAATGS